MPDISIIVPVENESEAIGALLELLKPMKERCEIIFVDGGSNDDTVSQIESMGYKAVQAPVKGRANQMNHGASISGGDVLWFLHADSSPPEDALIQIGNVINKGCKAGCFRIKFDSKHPLMLYNSIASNMRVRIRKIAFGDQGIFIRRQLFEELGGYAPIPLMEDYQLSEDIKKAGLAFRLAKGKIKTSARRYRKYGMLKTMLMMQALQRRYRRGHDPEEIAKAYDQNR